MLAVNDCTLGAKLSRQGKQVSAVDTTKLKTDFCAFHQENGYVGWTQPVLARFVDLCERLMYDNHYFRFDPETNGWMAEHESGSGPWIPVKLADYFDFS